MSEARRFQLGFIGLAAATTLIHLALALHYPLSEDETYYWDWSRNLDWGYYDQGPMIAWWIRAFCTVFGDTVLGVRAGGIVAFLGIQVVGYLTVRKLFDERAALWGVLAFTATPLALAGGFIFTYDTIMLLFWALAIHGLVMAVFGEWRWGWLVFGAFFGLGLLTKLTMVLLLPCALLFLLLSADGRAQLRKPWPWLSVALGLLLFLPNLRWQSEHGWPTFLHMSSLSGASQGKAFYERAADFLASQAALISPVLFVLFVLCLIWTWRHRSVPRLLLLWSFAAPILLFFLVSTLRSKVLGNWSAPGWYGACLLGGVWLAERSTKTYRALFHSGLALSVVLSLVAAYPELLAALGVRLPESINRPSNRMFGGRELAEAVVQRLRAESGLMPAATEYQQVSRLGFYMPGQPMIFCIYPGTRPNDYALRQGRSFLVSGQDLLLVVEAPLRPNELAALRRGFEAVEEAPAEVPIYRRPVHEEPVRTYYLYTLRDFKPADGRDLLQPQALRR